ncbi:hypothetical protein BBI01_06700 [Chryseobacterium artocarpi]|uniref:RNA polymerase sigma-70 factor n=1 Tax=Chryseobacterium artocarpi TaxID=1414727 RepID=A0A1B8ZXR3_9FLAO|nr:RNA polymerase sigma-70 factor [Chryseobacterium artocarpi]OCA76376.1 hypothetical protein BBI01_06700 [Chryseobacterium artocarpi]
MKSIMMIDEKELLNRLQNGDQLAFSHVFTTYYSGMCLFAEKYVGTEYAEDITENVFLKLLEAAIPFNDSTHLKAYLYRSVKHSCLDWLKSKTREYTRHSAYIEAYNEPQLSYLTRIMETETIRILYNALESLPDQTAQVMKMTYLDGLSNQKTADELGVSINTVKTHKQRGLGKLRQILPKEHFGILLVFLFS